MGLFGGGNSSSSSTAQEGGFSNVNGSALQLQGSNNRVTLSDSGAIKAAQSIATQSLQSSENIAGEALNQATLAQTNSSSAVSQALTAVAQSAQGQTQSIILEALKWGALVALGYFALKAFGKGGG